VSQSTYWAPKFIGGLRLGIPDGAPHVG